MPVFSKRYLITIILLLVTAFITFGAYSNVNRPSELYTQKIPLIINNWYGKDVTMEERTYEVLETKDAIMREYNKPDGKRVMFIVVFAESNRKVAHPPEVCFEGSGWARVDKEIQAVLINGRQLKFNRLTIQQDSEKQLVMYLYKAGNNLTPDYYIQQVNIIASNILRKKASSALIRISALIEDNIEDSASLLREFAEDMMPYLEKALP